MTSANSNVKSAILMVVGFSLSTAVAETYQWTGAAGDTDGVWAWNDAANWDVGTRGSGTHAVPGSSKDAGDTVVFSAMEGKTYEDKVTIDMTPPTGATTPGVGCLMIEGADAPAYQFGTSAGSSTSEDGSQSFWIVPFTDTSDAQTPSVSIGADVRADQTIMRLKFYADAKGRMNLFNHSAVAALTYETLDRSDTTREVLIYHLGTGLHKTLKRLWTKSAAPSVYFGGPRVQWRNAFEGGANSYATRPVKLQYSNMEFEIVEGGKLYFSNGTSPFTGNLSVGADAHVFGKGVFAANTHANSATAGGNEAIRANGIEPAEGKILMMDVPIMPIFDYDGYVPIATTKQNSQVWLNSSNGCTRAIRLYGYANVYAKMFGNRDCPADETSLGRGDEIVFSTYFENVSSQPTKLSAHAMGRLYYTGNAGETTDRDFYVTNSTAYTSSASGVVIDDQSLVAIGTAGTGSLKLTGNLHALNPNATFVLDAKTAPVEFAGTLGENPAVALAIAGDNEVRMAELPANAASVTLQGGHLVLTGQGALSGDMPVVVSGVGNELRVPAGATLTVPFAKLSIAEGAALDIVAPDSATVVLSGATSATAVPAGLTLNGAPVYFNDSGKLLPYESRWNAAVNGAWKDGTKWNNGVPTAQDKARITVGGADYTVTVDEPLAAIPASVEIGQGEPGFTSTLAIAADIESSAMPFLVNAGGELKVTTGGTLDLTSAGSSVDLSKGGTFTADGEGTVLAATSDSKVLTFGTGVWTFKGNSCLTSEVASAEIDIKPSEAGACAELVLDTSEIPTAGRHSFEKGSIYLGGQAGGSAKLVFKGKDDTNKATNFIFASQNPWRIGISRNGYGEIDMRGGYLRTGNNGLWIGSSEKESTALAVTGVVNQTGGYVYQTASGATASAYFNGLKIGCGEYCTWSKVSSDDIFCSGTYNLMGGQLLTGTGYTVIGAGSGVGRLVQTGGTFSHDSSANSSTYFNHLTGTKNFQYPMIIGLVGGSGLYVLSNGTAKVTKDFYIGGAQTNEMPWATTVGISPTTYPEENYDAHGVLSVQGGTFTCSSNVFVGVAGSGTIELGAAGSLTAKTLVLSNASESALSFAIPAGGYAAAPLAVTDRMKLTSGSKLTVDVRAITGRKLGSWTKLVAAPAIEGDFGSFEILCDEEDREFYKDATYDLSRNGEPGVWFRMPKKGLVLLYR